MRKVHRIDLSTETARNLQLLQNEADELRKAGTLQPDDHWKGNRRSQSILAALAALRQMVGSRERCIYCVDSVASDIEHFRPKTPFPERMYVWTNLLIACTQCGRFKGSQFPLTEDGLPLLIDPTSEDPWEFLDYDPETGNINARFVLGAAEYSAKGTKTVEILRLDRREYLSSGYRKTHRRLAKLVSAWVASGIPEDCIGQLTEADDHGLLGWCFNGSGQNDPPFRDLRERHPDAWAECQRNFS